MDTKSDQDKNVLVDCLNSVDMKNFYALPPLGFLMLYLFYDVINKMSNNGKK